MHTQTDWYRRDIVTFPVHPVTHSASITWANVHKKRISCLYKCALYIYHSTAVRRNTFISLQREINVSNPSLNILCSQFNMELFTRCKPLHNEQCHKQEGGPSFHSLQRRPAELFSILLNETTFH